MKVGLGGQCLKEHVHKRLCFFLKEHIELVEADIFELVFIFILFNESHNILCQSSRISITHVLKATCKPAFQSVRVFNDHGGCQALHLFSIAGAIMLL